MFTLLHIKLLSKHMLVFKTSSTSFQRNNFWSSRTSWRSLEDISQEFLKTSWKTRVVTLKTSSRHVFKTKKWRYLCLTNLNWYVSNKSIFHKSISEESKANLKSLIRTQWFQYSPYLEIQAAFLFWELKSQMLWNQLNPNSRQQNRWVNNNEILSNIVDKYI